MKNVIDLPRKSETPNGNMETNPDFVEPRGRI